MIYIKTTLNATGTKVNSLCIIGFLLVLFSTHMISKADEVYMEEFYIKEYAKYYDHRYEFEFEENTRQIGTENFRTIVKNDSALFIPLLRKNFDIPYKYLTPLRIVQIVRDETIGFLFYKHFSNIYYTKDDILKRITEYEYPLENDGRKKIKIIMFEQNSLEEVHKGYYIIWSSKPANGGDEGLNKALNIASVYMWGINKSTDTITTNLSIETIKSLYPDFEGVYNFKKYKSIEVDYQYTTMDDSFFKHIKFNE